MVEQYEVWRSAFKAYDIRGRIPEEINPAMAWRVGRAFAEVWQPKTVVVGRDVRPSSAELCEAIVNGLRAGGVAVVDIGLCGTEMIYFATAHLKADGGMMVTASHNPQDYNGIKLVQAGARPISGDSGLHKLRDMVCSSTNWLDVAPVGEYLRFSILSDYVAHLLQYVDSACMKPLRVVFDPGNGGAGIVLAELQKHFPWEVVAVRFDPDGTFPQGIPNPLLPENRSITSEVVRRMQADVGVAWDGDFDRCFFFDENGDFLEGYYIVGFLAEAFLQKNPGARIIHDPRLTWNTREIVERFGGTSIQSKTGHAFIKERMRAEDAVYGGEMSAHHYFRDFYYCDSGMIPCLLVLELLSRSGKRMSELMANRLALYPCSGEINRELADPKSAIKRVEDHFLAGALSVDRTDGISVEFADWRFNLRSSNTEPVVRLNVESRGDVELMQRKTDELLSILDQ